MPLGAPVIAGPATPAEIDTYRPAAVFISYASEDSDIAQAVYPSLQSLGETIYDQIKIFFDFKSISGGDTIREEIRTFLYKSDYLIVIYTGVFKRSHGYTGFEVGFFDALIQDEIRHTNTSARKIVSIFFDEQPAVIEGILGICMNIEPRDLLGSRADYVKRSLQSPDNPDVLARLFHEIADRAEERLTPSLRIDRDTLDKWRQKRKSSISQDIIPNLKGRLFDCLSTRITRRSVEQKLIEFELQRLPSDQSYVSIPDDAKLTQHSAAFEILGAPHQNEVMTWSEFKNEVRSRDALGGASILLLISP
jgi:hypothetical protein